MERRDHEEQAERWLDAGLSQYGQAEPRMGLERRVLAGVRDADRRSTVVWRRPVFASAVGLLLLGAAFLVRPYWARHSGVTAIRLPGSRQSGSFNSAIARTPDAGPVHIRRESVKRKATVPGPKSSEPRLDQFPSPRPLSPEEMALVLYVQARPNEAKLLAQAQAELLERDRLELEKPRVAP